MLSNIVVSSVINNLFIWTRHIKSLMLVVSEFSVFFLGLCKFLVGEGGELNKWKLKEKSDSTQQRVKSSTTGSIRNHSQVGSIRNHSLLHKPSSRILWNGKAERCALIFSINLSKLVELLPFSVYTLVPGDWTTGSVQPWFTKRSMHFSLVLCISPTTIPFLAPV